ncbi:MAG: hypothetical protein V1672_03370 [Candidatus Diapherotrites archaeon]
MDLFELISEEKAQSEWNSVYMLIVLVIAALLLIMVVKPMFQQTGKVISKTTPSASTG